MKNLKLLLVAFALSLSTAVDAKEPVTADSVSLEIEKVLSESGCDVHDDLSVTVFFSVSDDEKIQSLNIASENEEINQLLEKRLAHKELTGEFWRKGKIYELTVVKKLS